MCNGLCLDPRAVLISWTRSERAHLHDTAENTSAPCQGFFAEFFEVKPHPKLAVLQAEVDAASSPSMFILALMGAPPFFS